MDAGKRREEPNIVMPIPPPPIVVTMPIAHPSTPEFMVFYLLSLFLFASLLAIYSLFVYILIPFDSGLFGEVSRAINGIKRRRQEEQRKAMLAPILLERDKLLAERLRKGRNP
jgi:hypothetical protein